MLVGGETVDDFQEVTAAEKASIEANDAKWVEPSEEFVTQWNTTCGTDGAYNPSTGYFELNGLTDINFSEAVTILAYGKTDKWVSGMFMYTNIRTNIPAFNFANGNTLTMNNLCNHCGALEVFVFKYQPGYAVWKGTDLFHTFAGCGELKAIRGKWTVSSVIANAQGAFSGCINLEEIDGLIIGPNVNVLPLQDCPKLSWSTLQAIVSLSQATACTITLHADAYARLTDELIAEAANKQITFATV